jgi:predicted nucleotidyltransferase
MAQIAVDQKRIAAFCRKHQISRLALVGSVLHGDFHPDSDVDVLVEFEPGSVPGLFGLAHMERELSDIFGGRKVDLRTPEDLSHYFRQSVVDEAEVQYAQG